MLNLIMLMRHMHKILLLVAQMISFFFSFARYFLLTADGAATEAAAFGTAAIGAGTAAIGAAAAGAAWPSAAVLRAA